MRRLQLFAVVSLSFFCVTNSRAEGTFHIYNTLGQNHSMQVELRGATTGRTVRSGKFLEFKRDPWTQELVGGTYRMIVYGHGWSRDLGWIEVDKDLKEGNIYIGRIDVAWSLVEERHADGTTTKKWQMAVAAPTGQVPRKLQVFSGPRTVVESQIKLKPGERRIFGATVRKSNEGIAIDSINAGGAASRARTTDFGGERVRIEAGDQILEWNGNNPLSLEEFLSWVAKTDEVEMLVKKSGTGKTFRFTTKLD